MLRIKMVLSESKGYIDILGKKSLKNLGAGKCILTLRAGAKIPICHPKVIYPFKRALENGGECLKRLNLGFIEEISNLFVPGFF